MQHGNSIVTSFRVVECDIPTGLRAKNIFGSLNRLQGPKTKCQTQDLRVRNPRIPQNDLGSSSNIIFQMAYQDLGLEENTLTRKVTPLIGFSGEVKQTAGEGPEVKDTRNWGSFWRSRILDHSKNSRNHRRTYVDRSAWSPLKPFKVASTRKT
ncbi:hypothetical protein DY000_02060866 [Brassica cretica]|uniref:Uncharacterized protein n=1 Tax=Brassica cretica TaxID=69181 RepID=A0ABQ7B4G0_BRACR|nr:hypothetical protein DY000_02060866 [Brassica cretica]